MSEVLSHDFLLSAPTRHWILFPCFARPRNMLQDAVICSKGEDDGWQSNDTLRLTG